MESVLEAMVRSLFESVDRQLSQQLWRNFSDLFTTPVPVLSDPVVHKLQAIGMAIALGALPVMILYQVLRRTLDTMAGESTTPPEVLIRRCFIAGITVTGISLYAWFAVELAERLRAVVGGLQPSGRIIYLLFEVGTHQVSLISVLFLLVFLAAAGAVCIQRAILGAEFTLLLIVGAFLGVTRAVDEYSVAWQTWKRELAAILVTPLVQLLILYLFAERLAGMSQEQQEAWFAGITRWLESGALIYLLWNTPRWARQFTYSTGVAHSVAGAGAGVGRWAAMQMMFRAAVKGG